MLCSLPQLQTFSSWKKKCAPVLAASELPNLLCDLIGPYIVHFIQVNTNGVLSFRQPFDTSTPQPFPLAGDEILLAPFWDGHDILQGGRILYRFSTEPSLLSRVGERVGDAFELTFAPNLLFVVTWDDVAQFISSVSHG